MYIAARDRDQRSAEHILPTGFQKIDLPFANIYHQFVVRRYVVMRHVRKL